MKRFCGMMPSSEIEISKQYKDDHGLKITIEAGVHGWTITYADGGTKYKDTDTTTDENFKTAFDIATKDLGTLTEISSEAKSKCWSEA